MIYRGARAGEKSTTDFDTSARRYANTICSARSPGNRFQADGARLVEKVYARPSIASKTENAGESSHLFLSPRTSLITRWIKRPLSCGGCVSDRETFEQKSFRTARQACGIVVDRAERLAWEQTESPTFLWSTIPTAGSIESSLLLTSAAEDHAGVADTLALNGRAHIRLRVLSTSTLLRGLRQRTRVIVDHSRITAL